VDKRTPKDKDQKKPKKTTGKTEEIKLDKPKTMGENGTPKSGDLLNFDLTGNTSSLISSLQQPVEPVDLLADILGSVPTTTVSSPTKVNGISQGSLVSDILPIVAYNKYGIEINFHFTKTNQAGVVQVEAQFRNNNAYTVNDFSFMVAVPKYLTLEIQPSSGKQLLGLGQNMHNQKFRLTNQFHGQKPLVIRVQITFTDQGGNKVVDTAQVANFPPNC